MRDRTLLARIDFGVRPGLEEERGHVARQKRSRLRIHHVEPVMIDQHRLLLSPVSPALAADLRHDTRANGSRKGWPVEPLARLAAASACHFSQRYDLAY